MTEATILIHRPANTRLSLGPLGIGISFTFHSIKYKWYQRLSLWLMGWRYEYSPEGFNE